MKNYFLFLFFLVISVSGYAQGKRITGKVTDAADGMPIIGATVVAVDPDGKTNAKSVGTITDINGTFTLNVPNGCQELKFSYVGMEPKKGLRFDFEQAVKEVEALSETYGFHVDPRAKVSDLSVGERQRVEILKVLYRGVDILILDLILLLVFQQLLCQSQVITSFIIFRVIP